MKDLKEFLADRIEDISAQIADFKKELGKNYDQNSYGAGYDEGELSAYKNVKAFLEEEP
jgi:hypothetical protein